MDREPTKIIKSRYVTEKSTMLEGLHQAESNASVRKFDKPKYVFLVDDRATKPEIKWALEELYAEKKIKVTSVNTIRNKRKKRRVRGRIGYRSGFKKAVVTLEAGNHLDEGV